MTRDRARTEIIVPYDNRDPKSRLAATLSLHDRKAFAKAMLCDVIEAIQSAGFDPTLLSPREIDLEVPTIVNKKPLSDAVNEVLTDQRLPVAVLMGDLALITSTAVTRFVETDGDVVLAPGLGGGTNGVVVRDTDFYVDYHQTSYLKHLEIAREMGLTATAVDSNRLAIDIDEPRDLVEVLLHADGRASEWLNSQDFALSAAAGRTKADREQADYNPSLID